MLSHTVCTIHSFSPQSLEVDQRALLARVGPQHGLERALQQVRGGVVRAGAAVQLRINQRGHLQVKGNSAVGPFVATV